MSDDQPHSAVPIAIDTAGNGYRLVSPIAERLFDQIDVDDDETIEAIAQAVQATFEAAVRWTAAEFAAQLIEQGIGIQISFNESPADEEASAE